MKRFLFLFPFFLFPFLALAEEAPTPTIAFPCLLSGVAGFTCPAVGTSIPAYIINLYQFMVGVSGIVAVAMIVTGGIFITISGSVDKKSEGKDMITSALFGMALLLGSWLILSTVNTRLVENLDIPGVNPLAATSTNSVNINTGFACPEAALASCRPRVIRNTSFDVPTYPLGQEWLGWIHTGTTHITGTKWQHPYYAEENDGSKTIQCVIYAYKQSTSSSTIKNPLPSGIRPC